MTSRVDDDFRLQLEGYALATAEITYRMPDAKSLLQTYVWQEYDLAPKFPRLFRFLDFWKRELDGPLHSVRVTHETLLGPRDVAYRQHEFTLH
ncbi:MAG: aspartate-semialdehyde dehydrogenase [Pseudomonadota bacterium]